MNKNIMKKLGFGAMVKNVENKICPFCKEKIDINSFKNSLSKKEYTISGLCQICQDKTFGGEE